MTSWLRSSRALVLVAFAFALTGKLQTATRGSTKSMILISGTSSVQLRGPGGIINVPHSVEVGDFWIDRTEVSVERYSACVHAHVCNPPSCAQRSASFPVVCVSAVEADAFCAFEGKRLPTSEEWEYAACGSDLREFPWGNDEHMIDVEDVILPVEQRDFDVSPFGVRDMGANVGEWTDTRHDNLRYLNLRGENSSAIRCYDFGELPEDAQLRTIGFRCATSAVK